MFIDIVVQVNVCLSCHRTTCSAVLPVVVVEADIVLQVAVICADKIGFVIAFIVIITVGEILSTLEVTRTVALLFIGFSRLFDIRNVELVVMYPASFNGCCYYSVCLNAFHSHSIFGNISER